MLETIIAGVLVGTIVAILVVIPALFVLGSIAIAVDMYLANRSIDDD